MGGGARVNPPTAPEAQVLREMAKEGMKTPDVSSSAPGSVFVCCEISDFLPSSIF